MANEIQTRTGLACTNTNFTLPEHGTAQSHDQTGKGGGSPGHIIVGTAEEDVSLAEFTTAGWLYIRCMGVTGTGTPTPVVTWGPKSGGSLIPMGDLAPGEDAVFKMTETTPTLRIKSTDDDTLVQLVILEK